MTHKLHLPARPPSEGARRLAWWLLVCPAGWRAAARKLDMRPVFAQRLLAGEVAPGERVAASIMRLTRGDVHWSDWERRPQGAWGEMPDFASAGGALRKAA